MLPELGVVFDAGSAAYRIADYLETDTIDIFLSHAHLDHVVGLTFLFDVINGRKIERITVHGEPEKIDAVCRHLFSEFLFPVKPPFDTKVLQPRTLLADGAVLTHFPLKHPNGSVGYRVDWPDRSLAYVTDTVAAADADYVEKIRGVDLLIHECNFGDDQPEQAELTGHSCITQVAQVAAAAEVGRMVLVHLNPLLKKDADLDVASARRIFPNIEMGVDRMELEF
jgi:ribonuclease BN (tRNA processing enzyme)